MIVRIAKTGQYDIDGADEDRIFTLDVALDAALTSGDDARFEAALGELVGTIQELGKDLGLEPLLPADIVLPHPGSTLQEVRILLDSEAFED